MDTRERVPANVFCLQLHYCEGHYVLSCIKDKRMYVYDSLYNANRVNQVWDQLSILYTIVTDEQLTASDVIYVCSQSQGISEDCGPFAVANAVTLLLGKTPKEVKMQQNRLRPHIFQCLCHWKCSKILIVQLPFDRYLTTKEINRKRQATYRSNLSAEKQSDIRQGDSERKRAKKQ